ncbi:MAG: hypothetical protein ACFFD4_33085 [Candidatus Odinarchaeota archaeon]
MENKDQNLMWEKNYLILNHILTGSIIEEGSKLEYGQQCKNNYQRKDSTVPDVNEGSKPDSKQSSSS